MPIDEDGSMRLGDQHLRALGLNIAFLKLLIPLSGYLPACFPGFQEIPRWEDVGLMPFKARRNLGCDRLITAQSLLPD